MKNKYKLTLDKFEVLNNIINLKSTIFLIGIGGCGMSVIAQLLNSVGCKVYGSNITTSIFTDILKKKNIPVNFYHKKENILTTNPCAIIISTAISKNNIELELAETLNIPIFHRTHVLEYFIQIHPNTIGIMGSHGKGTHTGAILQCFQTKYSCSYGIGGILDHSKNNAEYVKDADYFIIEIDESDGTFFNLTPNILLIVNIQLDHVEFLISVEHIQELFINYIMTNSKLKKVYINISDAGSKFIYDTLNKKKLNFLLIPISFNNLSNINLRKLHTYDKYSEFKFNNNKVLTPFYSKFNIENLSNALSVAIDNDCNLIQCCKSLKKYYGLINRSTIKKTKNNINIIKIYAHDPDEIKLNLNNLLNDEIPVYAIYEPFGSKEFFINKKKELSTCFIGVNEILCMRHPNIEEKYENINSKFFNNHCELFEYIKDLAKGDQIFVFFTVNAKYQNLDIFKIADNLYSYLNNEKIKYDLYSYSNKNIINNYTISELCDGQDSKIYGNTNLVINNLVENDKNITQNCLFFCEKGNNYDPHDNIESIIDQGCICIVSEYSPMTNKVLWITTANIKKLKAEICYKFFNWKTKDIKIIGITGTNGKTSSCLIIKALLEQNNFNVLYIGTLGSKYNKNTTITFNQTTPSILTTNNIIKSVGNIDYLVMEVTSHALEEYRVHKLPFELVGLTNITQDHLDYHKTMDNYIKTKQKIFEIDAKYEIINSQYSNIINKQIKKFGYDVKDDYYYSNIKNGNDFNFHNKDKIYHINSPYYGKIYVENVCLSLSILHMLNIQIKTDYIYPIIPGRFQLVSFDPQIFIDFAHTPDALDNIISITKKINPNLWVIGGCGGDRDKTKRPIIGKIVNKYTQNFIITSDNPRTEDPLEICNEIKGKNNFTIIVDRKEAIIKGFKETNKNDIILIFGKGHERYTIFGTNKYYYNDEIFVKLAKQYVNKNILIIGNGISGISAKKILLPFSNRITYYDEDINPEEYDIIIPSPSIKPSHVIFNTNKYIIGEIELGYQMHSMVDWVAITGSNGKTTTVSILGKMFKHIVGNIGIGCSSLPNYIKYKEPIIAEISSYQLHTIKTFKPKIAVILNITENHLNYHDGFENYKNTKISITKNQSKEDILIVPYEDWAIRIKTNAKKVYYGIKLDKYNCFYLYDKKVFLKLDEKTNHIFNISELKLLGQHNLNNLMIAGVISYLFNKSNDQIEKVISTFEPLEHKIEFVRRINGITFINDSKSTTFHACVSAINALNGNIILLMGGDTKGTNPYSKIIEFSKKNNKIKKIICYGTTTHMIKENNNKNISIVLTLYEAVTKAIKSSIENDIILLSPACASWDQFNNYKERGNYFKKIIYELYG